MKIKRIGGLILIVGAYVVGLNTVFYGGILPAIGGIWSWAYGWVLVVGLAVSMVFYVAGNLLRGNIKRIQ